MIFKYNVLHQWVNELHSNLLEFVAGSWYCMHRWKRLQLQCKYMNGKLLFADTHLLNGCNLFFIPVPKEKLAVGHEVFLVHI